MGAPMSSLSVKHSMLPRYANDSTFCFKCGLLTQPSAPKCGHISQPAAAMQETLPGYGTIPPNAEFVQADTQNCAVGLGMLSQALNTTTAKAHSFKHYIFMNSYARGPFLPAYLVVSHRPCSASICFQNTGTHQNTARVLHRADRILASKLPAHGIYVSYKSTAVFNTHLAIAPVVRSSYLYMLRVTQSPLSVVVGLHALVALVHPDAHS